MRMLLGRHSIISASDRAEQCPDAGKWGLLNTDGRRGLRGPDQNRSVLTADFGRSNAYLAISHQRIIKFCVYV